MKKKLSVLLMTFAIIVVCGITFSPYKTQAASKVTVDNIDYNNLTMHVNVNGNSIIYFSTDAKKTWNELEGVTNSGYKEMDISWAASGSDVVLYLKGDDNTEVLDVTIPKQTTTFKVKYDKATGDFTFSGYDGYTEFMWRKSTDYAWHTVKFDESDQTYIDFLTEMDALKFKGAKVIFRTGQVAGTSADDMGERPSKEVSIAIAKRANAPSVKVNVTKMTLNTKTTMEYYSNKTNDWEPCEKNMLIEDVAPDAMYSAAGAQDVTLKVRVAETEKKPYSQSAMVVIPAQTASPKIGTDVTYKYENNKLILTFKASAAAPLEYCVVKPEDDFEESTAKWKTIKSNKSVSLSEKSAEDGTEIYFRFKGVSANASKGIELKLPSTYCSYTTSWPAKATPAA